jgi:hypothetical protein
VNRGGALAFKHTRKFEIMVDVGTKRSITEIARLAESTRELVVKDAVVGESKHFCKEKLELGIWPWIKEQRIRMVETLSRRGYKVDKFSL